MLSPFLQVAAGGNIPMRIGLNTCSATAQVDSEGGMPPMMTPDEYEDRMRLRATLASWQKGDPVPAMILDFPPPHAHERGFHCGMRVFGEFVGDFFYHTCDPDLLTAAVLDPSITDESLREALRQSLRLCGFAWTAALVADAVRQRPELGSRQPFARVWAALRSPCLRLKIARFDKDRPVPLDFARNVLHRLHDELAAGASWAAAYGRASEAMRNTDSNPLHEPFYGHTHLSYAFDGGATPDYKDPIGGFDLRKYEYATVPDGHLEVVFAAKGGTHLIDAGPALWLYHVEEYFDGMEAADSWRPDYVRS